MTRLISVLLSGFLFCGCRNLEPTTHDQSAATAKLKIRNNAASLLADLLGDEKNVSKVLLFKHNSKELGRLIKAISVTADARDQQLEKMAKTDPDLNLHVLDLPLGEQAARKSISRSKEHDLLLSSDQEFEFNLLLTQVEALNYGRHLAKIAAEYSSSPDEAQTFTAISQALDNQYQQVITRLWGRSTPGTGG